MTELDKELERCRKWIEDALEYAHGTHLFDDIADGIRKGVMQLWPTPRGCIVTEIVVFPRKKVVNIFLVGGELDQIVDMHESVIQWAKSQGCSALTGHGRAGWERPLKKYGWNVTHVSYEKEFD
jgi:hypothetical protein